MPRIAILPALFLMTAAPFYAEDAPIGVGVEEPAPKPQWETEPSGQRPLADEAEHGWTPVLLQFGGWEDFGDPPEPQPDVYGFGLGVFSVAAHDVVGAELALGCPVAQQAWGVQAGFIGAGAVCMNGIQAGGVMAGAERLDGVALSGVMAGAKRLDGVALSGLFAFAETGHGIVASLGFTDTGNAIALANAPLKPFTGIQLAGIANFASDITGVQLATVFNFAGELHGLQIGLFNRALSGCGVQLGLVNSFGRDDDVRSIPLLNARF